MKKLLSILVMLCITFSLSANNNGNNNNSTSNNETKNEITVVRNDASADAYNVNIGSAIPSCKGPAQPDLICTTQYDPVCGCDGKTYSNACGAIRAGVLVFVPGECGTLLNCIDPTKANPTAQCPFLYAPVCACGVLTFPNSCEALRLGFVNTTPGPCVETGQ